MGISLKTHKLLWGKSGNKCAFPDCRHDLIADETETDDESIIGDEAHIIAHKFDGPRGNSMLSGEDRDKYDNLVLLCRLHHKIIDDQPGLYTVEKLVEIKSTHEKWVRNSLEVDQDLAKDDLKYAGYIDEIFKLLDVENWQWTSSLISHDQPSIGKKKFEGIKKIPNYIVSRFWPGRYQGLEKSIFNAKHVLNNLIEVFLKYVEDESSSDDYKNDEEYYEILTTRKIYHIKEWNPELYSSLLDKYEYHVALIEDLLLEFTRAMNFVIEQVRKYMSPMFREKEGKLLLTSGPHGDGSWRTFKVEYGYEEKRMDYPYRGLKEFMTDREGRDRSFGAGFSSNYFMNPIFTA
jgi:hypothetical protein